MKAGRWYWGRLCTKLHFTTVARQLYPPSDKNAAGIFRDDVVYAIMVEFLETARRGTRLRPTVWLRLYRPCSDGLFLASGCRRGSWTPILSRHGMG